MKHRHFLLENNHVFEIMAETKTVSLERVCIAKTKGLLESKIYSNCTKDCSFLK